MIEAILEYARRFIGAPYLYGGNGPHFDCSGYVCEVMKSFGVLKWNEDLKAQELFYRFQNNETGPVPGSLVFFGTGHNGVNHVGLVTTATRYLEAGGGDSTTVDLKSACRQGAFVRERFLSTRKGHVGFYLPAWPTG